MNFWAAWTLIIFCICILFLCFVESELATEISITVIQAGTKTPMIPHFSSMSSNYVFVCHRHSDLKKKKHVFILDCRLNVTSSCVSCSDNYIQVPSAPYCPLKTTVLIWIWSTFVYSGNFGNISLLGSMFLAVQALNLHVHSVDVSQPLFKSTKYCI